MYSDFNYASTAQLDGLVMSVSSDSTKKRQGLFFVGETNAGGVKGIILLKYAGNTVLELPCDVGTSGGTKIMISALPSGGLSNENALSIVFSAAGGFAEKSVLVCPRYVFERCDSVSFHIIDILGATEFRGYLGCISDS